MCGFLCCRSFFQSAASSCSGKRAFQRILNRFRRFVRRAFLAAAALFSALLKDHDLYFPSRGNPTLFAPALLPVKKRSRVLGPEQMQQLLPRLPEPCRTVVLTALLAGLRIGEILALRWKRLDFLRGSIEVLETYSDAQGFGTPKTRSSERVIPMSSALRQALEGHRTVCTYKEPEDLVFCTNKGTPLSPKNLYNRALAPACDQLGLPRISWHSFRHANGTWIGEVGESVKTVQAILGHSDLETTLNIYMHAIPDSQRRAVERVAGVLFPDVPKLASGRPKPAN